MVKFKTFTDYKDGVTFKLTAHIKDTHAKYYIVATFGSHIIDQVGPGSWSYKEIPSDSDWSKMLKSEVSDFFETQSKVKKLKMMQLKVNDMRVIKL